MTLNIRNFPIAWLLRYLLVSLCFVFLLTLFWDSDLNKKIYYFLGLGGIVSFGFLRSDARLEQEEILFVAVLLAGILIAIVSWWINETAADAFQRYIEVRYSKLLIAIPLFFLIRRLGFPARLIWFVFIAGAISAGIVAISDSGLFDPDITRLRRASGGMNPIFFGAISLSITATLLPAFLFFKYRKDIPGMMFCVAGLVLGLLAVGLSGTRGSWLAVPFILVVFYCLGFALLTIWQRITGIVLILLVPIIALQIPVLHDRVERGINEILDYQKNYTSHDAPGPVGQRLEMWWASWEISKQHLPIGIGPGNYTRHAAQFRQESGWVTSIDKYEHPHNQYLTALVTRGVPGLVGLLALLIVPLRCFWHRARSGDKETQLIGVAGVLLVTGYAVFCLTDIPFETREQSMMYAFCLALLFGAIRHHETKVVMTPNA